MNKPVLGLSLMLEKDFLAGTLPLFENDEVEVLEWSPDIGWNAPLMPEWAEQLLQHYSDNERLLGHGVNFSPSAAVWTNHDTTWLENLKRELQRRSFVQFSEHFGCSRTSAFQQGAPLPVPLTRESVLACQKKLNQLADTVGVPIGLENLALAFSAADVTNHGQFLEEILSPFNGFMVLDLHNLYCQLVNFELSASELLDSYPLARVREIHISGGSWSEPDRKYSVKPIRRDTHDGEVPEEVFSLLPLALERCPNVEAVILERLGGTMTDADQQAKFRNDFRALQKLLGGKMPQALSAQVTAGTKVRSAKQLRQTVHDDDAEGDDDDYGNDFHNSNLAFNEIESYQKRLMNLLNTSLPAERIISDLQSESDSEALREYILKLEPRMINVGKELMKKWSR